MWRFAKLPVIVPLVLLSIGVLATSHTALAVHGSPTSYQLRPGIVITSNSGFSAANGVTGGNGTVANPFVIQGWEIDTGTYYGIDIRYTSAFFVIRDVYVHGLTYGISFTQVLHGSIENCTVSGNDRGIELEGSTNSTIAGNQIMSDTLGINLYWSSNTQIFGNNFAGDAQWIATYLNGLIHVFHNNFLTLSNTPGIAISESQEPTYFDNGYPSGGNFWYNYAGVDDCSGPGQNICPRPDGIGDTPYQIDLIDQDNYPLMKPYGPSPSAGPVWPTGSWLNASNIGVSSLTLSWNSALDPFGVYNYHVYESSRIIANVSALTRTLVVSNLAFAASYSFTVEAGDAWGNYTRDGPSLTVRVVPAGPLLELESFYVGAPSAGGSTIIVNNFTNVGQDLDQVTGMVLSGDIGTWSLRAVPFELVSTQSRIVNMTITIPGTAYAGNHPITVSASWEYYDTQSAKWVSAPDLSFSGSLPVQPTPPPTQPQPAKTKQNNTISSVIGLFDFLASPEGLLIATGIAGTAVLCAVTAVLATRRTGRSTLRSRVGLYCPQCGQTNEVNSRFCLSCGRQLEGNQ